MSKNKGWLAQRELRVACPTCKAKAGEKCWFDKLPGLTTSVGIFHKTRRLLADQTVPFSDTTIYVPDSLIKPRKKKPKQAEAFICTACKQNEHSRCFSLKCKCTCHKIEVA